MQVARSKVTAQGQISVPADVRRRLGVGPGSLLEWTEEDGKIIVRRAGRFSSEDIHRAIWGGRPPAPKTTQQMKEGIRNYVRKRYARD